MSTGPKNLNSGFSRLSDLHRAAAAAEQARASKSEKLHRNRLALYRSQVKLEPPEIPRGNGRDLTTYKMSFSFGFRSAVYVVGWPRWLGAVHNFGVHFALSSIPAGILEHAFRWPF